MSLAFLTPGQHGRNGALLALTPKPSSCAADDLAEAVATPLPHRPPVWRNRHKCVRLPLLCHDRPGRLGKQLPKDWCERSDTAFLVGQDQLPHQIVVLCGVPDGRLMVSKQGNRRQATPTAVTDDCPLALAPHA